MKMSDPLKKIPLEAVAVKPMHEKKKRRISWKAIVIPAGILLIIFIILGILLMPLGGVLVKAKDFAASAKEAGASIKNQDLDKSKIALAEARKKLDALDSEYKKVSSLSVIPLLGAYIGDGQHALRAARAGLDAGGKAIEALEPQADLLGLKGKSKFVSGTADERIQTAVKTMTALTPKINEIATHIETLRSEINAIDADRYPAALQKVKVREQLEGIQDVINNAANLFVNAQPLLINLPDMLGMTKEKRYLILFQNDKELRATGGFITAYAQFRFVKGKAILEKADDIYALDGAKKKNFPAPREILAFHKGVYNLNIRDSNLSPDFKLSMQSFETLYDSVSGKEQIDGIWAVDTHVLVETLKILGSMNVAGRVFSADIDKRCDCPKAVYELEDYSTRPVNYVRTARKDIIGILFQQLLQQALGVSPSKYWGKLFQMLLTEINQKHVVAYFHDDNAQRAVESFNMAGRIMTASETATLLAYKEGNGWDYLHINNSNMAGAKANMFVSEKVTKDVTVTSDGTMTTKLSIEYKNPFPGSDCGLESGGLCLNAPLRNWVRIYTPTGSKLVDSKGAQSPKDNKPVPLDTYDSLSKTVFEGFLIVNPLGTARLDVTYTSPFKSTDGKYRLLIQKQGGTTGQEWFIRLGGKDRKKMTLDTDTELVL